MSVNHSFVRGTSPIVFTAIHDGHQTRDELKELFNLSEAERLREEDPFTAEWLDPEDNRIIVHHSRFEADVNRPREKAVYRVPEDAWGLKVWKTHLPAEILDRSLRIYDGFYRECKAFFDDLFTRHANIVVYDIHSYNHRRESADKMADPAENPEINLGTKNMDRDHWDLVIRSLTDHFERFDFKGRHLDTRENVKFKGGHFGRWLYEQYGKKICPISIEVKKFFMDEHTGEPHESDLELIGKMMNLSKKPVLQALKKYK